MLDVTPKHEYLIGIDSDGCVFDTMELKHKECFIPEFIKHYKLQGVSKLARETWEFVNLYSRSRGINRFPALLETLRRLQHRPEVLRRGVRVEIPQGLAEWVESETRLGNPALAAAVERTSNADLQQALTWSKAVNRSIEEMVHGAGPFPLVRECLEKMRERADLLVVSATPGEALCREWEEHDLSKYVHSICGQELGTKKEMLGLANKYGADRALMVGDAPGDYAAAKANQALFFPINPGREETSWKRLYDEGIERFVSGSFAGPYQQNLLDEFESCLPVEPPWKVAG